MRRIVVVGGGVAGMAAAYTLQWGLRRRGRPRQPVTRERRGVEVLCFEAGYVPGGSVQTETVDGFVLEAGPDGIRDCGPAVRDLIRRLGLAERRVPARAADFQVFRNKKLRHLPAKLRDVVSGDLLPAGAALRALAEPLARRGKRTGDETVESFARRRLGREAGGLLADVLATATCGGDAGQLSMRGSFPRLAAMEADHGSLLRGLRRPEGSRGGPLVTFPQGLGELKRALVGRLGACLRTGVGVCAVSGMGDRGLRVLLEEGPPLDADAVVLACPAADAAAVVGDHDAELAALLAEIPSVRTARVHLGYRKGALQPWPSGAGFVAPRDEGLRALSAEWTSNAFPGRAPANGHLVTVTFGGARDPEALELDDEKLVARARKDLERAVGLVAAPYLTRVTRLPMGLPQYPVGQPERLERIEQRLATWPRLALTGCSYRGTELGACVQDAVDVAERTLHAMRGEPAGVPA